MKIKSLYHGQPFLYQRNRSFTLVNHFDAMHYNFNLFVIFPRIPWIGEMALTKSITDTAGSREGRNYEL